MMDCDTTGVEPDIALVKYKKLVGGGMIKIVNQTVPLALKKLGYDDRAGQRHRRLHRRPGDHRGRAAPARAHLPVFDCAFKAANGARSIHYMGHVKMMGAVQPFISGAISKTVNMPPRRPPSKRSSRPTSRAGGWALKAIAIYRDGSKRTQPLNTSKDGAATVSSLGQAPKAAIDAAVAAGRARRCGASCPTSASRSPTSSTSPATRATSPSACTRTARRARSSSRWPRKARPSRA